MMNDYITDMMVDGCSSGGSSSGEWGRGSSIDCFVDRQKRFKFEIDSRWKVCAPDYIPNEVMHDKKSGTFHTNPNYPGVGPKRHLPSQSQTMKGVKRLS